MWQHFVWMVLFCAILLPLTLLVRSSQSLVISSNKNGKERWLLNIHAIDTRGVVDRLGCTKCRCDLYNITRDVDGKPLDPNYAAGGLKCCHDQTQCKVKEGVSSFMRRSLYLRYTMKWVDWEDVIVPVKIYILDVTDTAKKVNDSTSLDAAVGCKVEYEVEACGASGVASNGCIDSKISG